MKITDFGIAKAVDAAPVTKTGMVMGTAQYISPEQASGEDATAASDVYSLGVVGYECLTGYPPFTAETAIALCVQHIREEPPALPAWVPGPVDEIISRALAKEPSRRFADGGELAEAVARITAPSAHTSRSRRAAADAPTRLRDQAAYAPTRLRTVERRPSGPAETTHRIDPTAQTHPPTDRGRRRRSLPAAGALGVAALAIVGAFLLGDSGDASTENSAVPTSEHPGTPPVPRTMADRPTDARIHPARPVRPTEPTRHTATTTRSTSPTSTTSTTPTTSTTTSSTSPTSTTATTPTTTTTATTTTSSAAPQAESRV